MMGIQLGIFAMTPGQGIMILVGLGFIAMAIKKEWEPLELLPIGVGMILANLPLANLGLMPSDPSVDQPGEAGVLGIILEWGLREYMILPQLIFFCIGAMTDFGPLIANPKSFLLGAAAQIGIYVAFIGAILFGFNLPEACSVAIIGGADGPTTIYTTGQLAPDIIGVTATAAYSYMAMVALIQPPIIKLLTSKRERAIQMKPMMRPVSQRERIFFAVLAPIVIILLIPKSGPLVGLLFAGNLFRESKVVERLTKTAQSSMVDVITILLMLGVGASMPATLIENNPRILLVLVLGLVAFAVGTAGGVLLGKVMSRLSKEPYNPMLGAAGVSAVPMAARVVHHMGQEANKKNYLLMHAMGPNAAGVIGSAVAAGYFLSLTFD
jgi:oxaloacetate decarboxylase beta subunit